MPGALFGRFTSLTAQYYPHADTNIMLKPDISYLSMKTLIEVYREGKYFVAIDLLTNVADQGLSEQEALQN
jgi:hypothetical protein